MSEALVKVLLDKRALAWSEAQDIRERAEREGRDLSTEEDTTFNRALDDVERLDKQVRDQERADRLGKVEASTTAPSPQSVERTEGGDEAAYRAAFDRFLRRGFDRMPADQRDLVEAGFVQPEARAQGTTPDTAGGYTVPDTMLNKITDAMKAFGGLGSLVGGFTTDSGNPLNWPTSDETAAEGEIIGENVQHTEDDITFRTNTLGAYTYSSKVVRVSLQLIQDSGLDVEAFVGAKLGQRLGRITARHVAAGTGTGQPQGVSAAAAGATGATSASAIISYDNLVDLEHSVDPAYRTNAQYALNDLSVALIRKLKDANNRMLWVPSMQVGVPSTINGRPYTVDNGLPAPAAGGVGVPGSKSVYFGDFNAGYVLRRVNGGQLLRLSERYADFLQVGFLSFLRLDGKLDDLAAIRAYQHGNGS